MLERFMTTVDVILQAELIAQPGSLDIDSTRSSIYEKGDGVKSKAVENVLRD